MPRWEDEPITFDRAETLQSALAKLDCSGNGWPYVVLAPKCPIADNALTYKLLARASERLASPIAVVSGNARWRQLAREHGLRAYGSVGSLRRARRRSPLYLPEALIDSLFSALTLSGSGEGWAIIGGFLLVASVVAFFLLPVMTITIRTPVENLNQTFNARVDVDVTGVDTASGTIPGRTIEHRFTVSDTIDTTGKKKVGKEKAKGEVTLINSSPGLVMLPIGTILSTGSGERFATAAAVAVGPFGQGVTTPSPGSGTTPVPASGATPAARPTPTAVATAAARPAPAAGVTSAAGALPTAIPMPPASLSGVIVRVPVVAVEAGEKGNVPALAISKVEGDAYRGLTVLNEQPLTGGTDAEVRSASDEDRSKLKETLLQKARSQALSELTLRVRQSESLIPHSMQVKIEREDYDKGPDEEADRLKGTIDAVATAIAFANQDLNSLADGQWRANMPKGYRALAGQLDIAPPEVVEAAARTAGLRLKVTGRVERMLEIDDLTQSLRGVSVPDARAKLGRLESPLRLEKVEMWPDWAPRAYRVEVETVQ